MARRPGSARWEPASARGARHHGDFLGGLWGEDGHLSLAQRFRAAWRKASVMTNAIIAERAPEAVKAVAQAAMKCSPIPTQWT